MLLAIPAAAAVLTMAELLPRAVAAWGTVGGWRRWGACLLRRWWG